MWSLFHTDKLRGRDDKTAPEISNDPLDAARPPADSHHHRQ